MPKTSLIFSQPFWYIAGRAEIASTGKCKYGKVKYKVAKCVRVENSSTENSSTAIQEWKKQVWKIKVRVCRVGKCKYGKIEYENMTSSTKPEIHNIPQRHQRRTNSTVTGNMYKKLDSHRNWPLQTAKQKRESCEIYDEPAACCKSFPFAFEGFGVVISSCSEGGMQTISSSLTLDLLSLKITQV